MDGDADRVYGRGYWRGRYVDAPKGEEIQRRPLDRPAALWIALGTKLEAIDSVGELALEALALAAASLLGSAGVTFLVIKLLDRKKRRAAHEDDA